MAAYCIVGLTFFTSHAHQDALVAPNFRWIGLLRLSPVDNFLVFRLEESTQRAEHACVLCRLLFFLSQTRERETFLSFSLFCLRVLLVPSTGSGFGYLFLPSFFFFFFASSSSSFSSTVLIGSQGVQDACATPRRTTPHWQFRP